jgi:hypothetical protein
MPTDDTPVQQVTPTVAGKALAGTNLAANLGSAGMLAVMVLQQLPDFKVAQNEKLAAVQAVIVEQNRTLQLLRDEMRDARHDLTELRRVSARSGASFPKTAEPDKP